MNAKSRIAACLILIAGVAVAGPAFAQKKKPKSDDPRAACIRETEKTYPPRTLSRQQRDMFVEQCMSRKR